MKRLLLAAALLVACVAPAWAQSDNRFIIIWAPCGTLGKGGDRYGDANITMGSNPHVVETMLRRMGVPYKVVPMCDSTGGWTSSLGTTRGVDEADSVYIRRIGCMGWISYMSDFSVGTALKTFTGEIRSVFTDAEGHTGVQQGSPTDGLWGIPGVIFLGGTGPAAGGNLLCGVSSGYTVSGSPRNRSLFANGDSLSTDTPYAHLSAAAEAANFTPIVNTPDYDANGDSLPMAAWLYKNNCLYYSSAGNPYMDPKMLMLGIADVLNRAGYTPRRKLNFHIDADHLFPDATVQTAPSDSFFKYIETQPWRFGGPIEANSSELADDDPNLKVLWLAQSIRGRFVSHPHSHNFLNFGDATKWNFSTFSDSATKRARWNDMTKQIADTLRGNMNLGVERTATLPNNDVQFPDLYIMASAGYRDIRSRPMGAGVDSIGPTAAANLRRWQQVPGPRVFADPVSNYGLPYGYIEPKTNKLLYVHDSVEHPSSSDSLSTALTDFSVSMEGFASRNLSSMCRMAIWDGGQYFHPDINFTRGRFMADFYRRFTYYYNRVKNIATVSPVYLPKEPRRGGTSRTTYTDNR